MLNVASIKVKLLEREGVLLSGKKFKGKKVDYN